MCRHHHYRKGVKERAVASIEAERSVHRKAAEGSVLHALAGPGAE